MLGGHPSNKSSRPVIKRKRGGHFSCPICFIGFKFKQSRNRHFEAVHVGTKFICEICQMEFKYKTHLYNHLQKVHQKT